MSIDNLENYINKVLNEATSSNASRGSYNPPMRPGLRKWLKNSNDPFNKKISNFVNSENYYDSLDGEMSKNNKNISKKERIAKHIRDKDFNIEYYEGGDDEFASAPFKKIKHKQIDEWIEVTDELLNEDLAVWFGTKKKPKGSKQPKGPWVNICRKKEGGGHPPCGRPEAKDKGYPKCRAAGVAARMSDSQKKAACAQKRRAEKTNPKGGTGNKPKMVSYKPRLKESELFELIKKIISEQKKGGYSWTAGDTNIQKPDTQLTTVSTYTKTTSSGPEKLKNLSNVLYNARNVSWKESTMKSLFNNYSDCTYLSGVILKWIKSKPTYDENILKAAICLIFRESKGSLAQLLSPKELFGAFFNLFGGDHSQGYIQVKPSTAKQYGIDMSSVYTVYNSLDSAYKMMETNYNIAKKKYSGNLVTIYKNNILTKVPALGNDAALHIAVAAHNGGMGIISDWCETNLPGIANLCSQSQRKPYDNKNIIAKTNKNKKISNYIPNIEGIVTKYMPQFETCFNALSDMSKYLPEKDIKV